MPACAESGINAPSIEAGVVGAAAARYAGRPDRHIVWTFSAARSCWRLDAVTYPALEPHHRVLA